MDALGVIGSVVVAMPIELGTLPTTYTGRTITSPWSCR